MAHSVSTLVVRVDQQPVRMFYNQSQKQKRVPGQQPDPLHHSNADEPETRLKTQKWPIPYGGFTTDKRLNFASTYPDFTIGEELSDSFDLSKCQAEVMDVHDLQYCFHYLQTKDPNKVYILNSNGVSCGVIRAVRIAPGDLPTTEQFEKAMREDPSQI